MADDVPFGELTEDIAHVVRDTGEGGEGDDALIVKFVQQIITNADASSMLRSTCVSAAKFTIVSIPNFSTMVSSNGKSAMSP